MTIGEALKQARLHRGLTQEQMANGIISESFYSKVERDVHQIDTNLLLNILISQHIDVGSFFSRIIEKDSRRNDDESF